MSAYSPSSRMYPKIAEIKAHKNYISVGDDMSFLEGFCQQSFEFIEREASRVSVRAGTAIIEINGLEQDLFSLDSLDTSFRLNMIRMTESSPDRHSDLLHLSDLGATLLDITVPLSPHPPPFTALPVQSPPGSPVARSSASKILRLSRVIKSTLANQSNTLAKAECGTLLKGDDKLAALIIQQWHSPNPDLRAIAGVTNKGVRNLCRWARQVPSKHNWTVRVGGGTVQGKWVVEKEWKRLGYDRWQEFKHVFQFDS